MRKSAHGGVGDAGRPRRVGADHHQRARAAGAGAAPPVGRRRAAPAPGTSAATTRGAAALRVGGHQVDPVADAQQADHAGVGQPHRHARSARGSRRRAPGRPAGRRSPARRRAAARPGCGRPRRRRDARRDRRRRRSAPRSGRRPRAPCPAGRSWAATSTATVGGGGAAAAWSPAGDGDRGQQRGEQPAAAQHGAAYGGRRERGRGGRGARPCPRRVGVRGRRGPALHRAAGRPALGGARRLARRRRRPACCSDFAAGLDDGVARRRRRRTTELARADDVARRRRSRTRRRAAVGAVEARALEHHADGVEDLAQPAVALRALGQRVVGEALELLEGVAALGAGVLVGRHGVVLGVGGTRGAGTRAWRLPMVRHGMTGTMSDQPGPPPRRRPSTPRPARAGGAPSVGWPRPLRVTTYVAVGAGAAAGGRRWSPAWCWCAGRSRRPAASSSCPASTATVEVVRDDHGIPQLYGDSVDDLMRAQGYVHAQERFFEMDVRRHVTAGRLAELFGEDAARDRRDASAPWAGGGSPSRSSRCSSPRPGPRSRPTPTASTPTSTSTRPAEIARRVHRAQRRRPRLPARARGPPVDSLAWLKAMAWDLRGNMNDEIDRVLALADHSAEQVQRALPAVPLRRARADRRPGRGRRRGLRPGRRPGRHPQPAAAGVRPPARGAALRRLRAGLGADARRCWAAATASAATAGSSTASTPRPASRCWPTTRTSASACPGVWMQMGLHCRTVSRGLPARRRRLHLLRRARRGHRPQRRHRLGLHQPRPGRHRPLPRAGRAATGGATTASWRPLRTRTETIEVHGGDDVELTVRSTAHGPLLSDVVRRARRRRATQAPGRPGGPTGRRTPSSLEWTALHPRADRRRDPRARHRHRLGRVPGGGRATSPSRRRTSSTPTREGHIGYQAPGRIPIRKSGNDGYCPPAGLAAGERLDRRLRAVRRAAQRARPRGGVHRHRQPGGDRRRTTPTPHRRLGPGLPLAADPRPARAGEGELSVDEMADAPARRPQPDGAGAGAVPARRRRCRGGYYSDGQRLLRDWDFTQPADSAAAAYFNVVWSNLLAADLPRRAARGRCGPTAATAGSRWSSHLLRDPADPWWDDAATDDGVETRDDILRRGDARRPRRADPARRHVSPDEWTLGPPAPARPAPADARRVRHRRRSSGCSTAAAGRSAAAARPSTRRRGTPPRGTPSPAAPSMRMVVSLGDLDDSRWINLTGVSGHPFDAHYTDQTDLWAEGETLPWPFTPRGGRGRRRGHAHADAGRPGVAAAFPVSRERPVRPQQSGQP